MSKQTLNLENNWEDIKENFREHFPEDKLEIKENRIIYNSGSEHLEIHKNGKVSGAMPLHTAEIEKADKIIINDSKIEIISKTPIIPSEDERSRRNKERLDNSRIYRKYMEA